MNPLIGYMIEATLGVCFFLLVYQTLLKKETNHRFKRVYLLFSLAISAILPFFHFQLPSLLVFDNAIEARWLPEIQITALANRAVARMDWFWVYAGYGLGVALFLVAFVFRVVKIIVTVSQSPRLKYGSIWIVELNDGREVFSFFKYIFIGKSLPLSENERKQIIAHERVHVDNFHSLDILLLNVLGIFFWFNPLIKIYRNSLVQLHEFEADARSVEAHEVDAYCCLLARAALKSSGYQLANHFTNSLTLKRIEMMKTVKTKMATWKIAAITGAALVFCCLVAGNGWVLAQAKTDQESNSTSEEAFKQVDQIPTFGQGNDLWKFIAENLRYPTDAQKRGVEGKVFVEFVVEKDGSLSNVKALKGIGYGCDEEVVRIVKSLPKWKPGEKDGKIVRTTFVIPIIFQLSAPKKGG